jgi:hypothetical protein
MWASLNIENLFDKMVANFTSEEIEPIRRVQRIQSTTSDGGNIDYGSLKESKIIESQAKFIDFMPNCETANLTEDIWAIHTINNEGYRRK